MSEATRYVLSWIGCFLGLSAIAFACINLYCRCEIAKERAKDERLRKRMDALRAQQRRDRRRMRVAGRGECKGK